MQIWLNPSWFLRMAQDLKQVIVGQEEEPRKGQALLGEVVSKAFLDPIEGLITTNEAFHEPALKASLKDKRAEQRAAHCAPPNLVHSHERSCDEWKLRLDIW
jgi:hypothetical protein